MSSIIYDIETVGEKLNEMDETTRHILTKHLESEEMSAEERQAAIEEVDDSLGLSPLTGQIVSIGLMDADTRKGGVYYQSPGVEQEELVENDVKLVAMTEPEMIERFWHKISRGVDVVVGFNSRCFDAFFLNVRSAAHGIRPSVDLMGGRYLYQQRGIKHVDLYDQLTGYGAVRGRGMNLHMWCRVAGIDSPKEGGMDGSEVGQAFAEGRFLEIARYNAGDLHSTVDLYLWWLKHLNFQQL